MITCEYLQTGNHSSNMIEDKSMVMTLFDYNNVVLLRYKTVLERILTVRYESCLENVLNLKVK